VSAVALEIRISSRVRRRWRQRLPATSPDAGAGLAEQIRCDGQPPPGEVGQRWLAGQGAEAAGEGCPGQSGLLGEGLDGPGVRGVVFALGTSLREPPPVAAGVAHTFTATLRSGQQLTADIWFRCFGAAPITDHLADELATARQADGRLAVTPKLRLPGQERVFAVGDITAIPEAKRAAAAEAHARVVAANIRVLLHGGEQAASTPYPPGPEGIVVPLGPKGGATFAPGWEHRVDRETAAQIRDRARERNGLLDRDILDAETTVQLKSADLTVGRYTRLLGLE
jgi:hypothetical protein